MGSGMSCTARSSRRPTATRASPSGTSSASASIRPLGRPSGLYALLDAEPFLHPAGLGPRLALRDVAPERAGAHRAGAGLVGGLEDPVVAHPPDTELELAAVVVVERVEHAGAAGLGEDEHVAGRRGGGGLRVVDVARGEVTEVPGVRE